MRAMARVAEDPAACGLRAAVTRRPLREVCAEGTSLHSCCAPSRCLTAYARMCIGQSVISQPSADVVPDSGERAREARGERREERGETGDERGARSSTAAAPSPSCEDRVGVARRVVDGLAAAMYLASMCSAIVWYMWPRDRDQDVLRPSRASHKARTCGETVKLRSRRRLLVQ